eukprot:CAMPEP_0185211200 /NCGR_PEP_ID=MMETSP1140-20130426/66906_1 /TAXON_ID=298111 /ORGANISM="Pavlova sp., Strain CCMP459" /LENGTH=204 /DNA_ID=CAMNT_0027779039 /DNA_START=124 /DNA_END=736 /DNA_ORIENTATION=-
MRFEVDEHVDDCRVREMGVGTVAARVHPKVHGLADDEQHERSQWLSVPGGSKVARGSSEAPAAAAATGPATSHLEYINALNLCVSRGAERRTDQAWLLCGDGPPGQNTHGGAGEPQPPARLSQHRVVGSLWVQDEWTLASKVARGSSEAPALSRKGLSLTSSAQTSVCEMAAAADHGDEGLGSAPLKKGRAKRRRRRASSPGTR